MPSSKKSTTQNITLNKLAISSKKSNQHRLEPDIYQHNLKYNYDDDESINSQVIDSDPVLHDIYKILPSTDEMQVNDKVDQQPIDELLQIIHEELKDITATNMNDLMRLTQTSAENEVLTHVISVKPDCEPIKQKSRGIPFNFRADFKKTILEMKAAGMVVDSKSPWCSPVRLVRKKDGTIRICVDFRKLNNVTIKDSYSIPKIDKLFVILANETVFTTLDLASGYYQVKMDQQSQEYTAFACDLGSLNTKSCQWV